MPEYSGSLQSFELAILLWVAPLLPLLAVLYAQQFERKTSRAVDAVQVAIASFGAALAILLYHAVALLGAPAGSRTFVSHGWLLLRVGSLDLSYTLSCDPTTALLSTGACAACAAALGRVHASAADDATRVRAATGIGLAGAGSLLVLLGDGLGLMVAGGVVSGLGAFVLNRAADARRALHAFVIGRAGDLALLGAAVILLWGAAGGWSGGAGYVADYRARLVAVQRGAPPQNAEAERSKAGGMGELTMGALPGATVSVAGAQLCAVDGDGKRGGIGTAASPCREVARTPFAKLPLPAAVHDVVVVAGPGTFDLTVDKIRVGAGRETLITVAGATTVLRELRDQLALEDNAGKHVLRAEMVKRKLLGQPLLGIVAALLALTALLRGLAAALSSAVSEASSVSHEALIVVAGASEVIGGALILARTDFLFLELPRTAALTALVAVAAAAWAAFRAGAEQDVRRLLGQVAAASASLAVATFAAGAHAAGATLVFVHVVAMAAFVLAIAAVAGGKTELDELAGAGARAPLHARAAWIAAAAASGAPLPLGAFWGRDALLHAAAQSDTLPGLGWTVLVLAAVASFALAFAIWRVTLVVFNGSAPHRALPESPALGAPALGLALLAALLGLLAPSAASVGHALPAPLERWLSPSSGASGEPLDRMIRWGLVVLGWGVASAGLLAATQQRASPLARVFGAPRRDLVAPLLARPALAAVRGTAALEHALVSLLGAGGDAEPAEPAAGSPPVAAQEPEARAEAKPEAEPEAGPRATAEAPSRKKKKGRRR